jgi:hypothetical protein
MELHFGGPEITHSSCNRPGRFQRAAKQMALACRACGPTDYSCIGTPFETLRLQASLARKPLPLREM